MDPVRWSSVEVTKHHFEEGGFRRTYKASSDNILFQNKSWVLKKLENDAECQMRKVVRIHCLSRHLAFAFEQLCSSNLDLLGHSFSYRKIYYGLCCGEHIIIEEYIDGEFTKCVNNTGPVFSKGEIGEKALAFIHFTWERSGENLMLLDLKG